MIRRFLRLALRGAQYMEAKQRMGSEKSWISCFQVLRQDMKGDERSEVAKLGLGVNVKIVDVKQESVRLFWLWSAWAGSVCGLRDYKMEAGDGQI